MTTGQDTESLIGTIEEGVVRRVLDYGADVELSRSKAPGYLHISQVREEFTSPPLTDLLRVGDTLPVVVVCFDGTRNCWGVSHRAYKNFQKLQTTGLQPGQKLVGEVLHATELRCSLRVEGVQAQLSARPHPWSSYRVLFESGALSPGSTINVEVDRWDASCEALRVQLPQPDVRQLSGEVQQAKVILLRARYVKKNKQRLQNIIYATIDGSDIIRIEAHELLKVEEGFPAGSSVPLRINAIDAYSGMFAADIAWELTQFSALNVPAVGEIRRAPVIWISERRAHCLLDNRVVGYFRKSSVLGEVRERLDTYLDPGDIVEVRIFEHMNVDVARGACCRVDFLRRLKEQFADRTTDEGALVDLGAVRRAGATGGFVRDASFRWNVLEAYDHRCCVCGVRYTVQGRSAMEAAHIVPRSNRGSDLLQNALCLCPMHHWAFDNGLFTIDDELVIRAAGAALSSGEEGAWITKFHGQVAHIGEGDRISRAALSWHRRNIFIEG